MGGVNESVSQAAPAKAEKKERPRKEKGGKRSDAPALNPIRTHENAGEIHFHDDGAGIKAAVPVADWWTAWQKLSTLTQKKYQFADRKNGTVLTVRMTGGKKGPVDAAIVVERATFGQTYENLQKLTSKDA